MAAVQIDEKLLSEVENYIKTNKVMIFSKSYCPYCIRVKELFKSLGVDYHALELDLLDNCQEIQDAMAKKAGKRSVPQVFIDGDHVGGCDDTLAAHKSGELKKRLSL